MYDVIKNMPKAELHVHFDGTIEAELLLTFADRNRVKIPYKTVEDVHKAYKFETMQEFCDSFNVTTMVLVKEQDFYDVMWNYLAKVVTQGVKHAEVFFDTQTYKDRGLRMQYIIDPLFQAIKDAEKTWGITGGLILCFLRHLSEQDAFDVLENSLAFKDKILGVGLAANEINNPASKFARVFARAREYGYHTVAHAGEHDGPDSIRAALDMLRVERIDHGVRCMEDPLLVQELVACQLPLTVCPLSNVALGVYPSLKEHPIKRMLDAGLAVSIHSDDPAYFGGYIVDNYFAAYSQCGLTVNDIITCAKNSFKASFIQPALRNKYVKMLNDYLENYTIKHE